MNQTERANFGTKLGIILATAGSAVGLGNVWRFPYMTGQNGGAAFILIYIACVLILGIPCMLNEFIIGRRAQANTARSYASLANGTPWRLIGLFGVFTGFMITGYYVVVSGWCLQYIYASAAGHLTGDADYVKTYFENFSSHPWKPILWMLVFMLMCHFIITRGPFHHYTRCGEGYREGVEDDDAIALYSIDYHRGGLVYVAWCRQGHHVLV